VLSKYGQEAIVMRRLNKVNHLVNDHVFEKVLRLGQEPAVVTSEEFRMHDVLNEFLLSKDQLPLSSIANTLFPAGLYLKVDPMLSSVNSRRSTRR
jgi:hypothetical protein